jgi:hypothetical protein
MGIFPYRGLEYRIKYKNNEYLIVIPMKQLDGRLLQSRYYLDREDSWFDHLDRVPKLLEEHQWKDIILTQEEKDEIKNKFGDGESHESHGMYDVFGTWSTLTLL